MSLMYYEIDSVLVPFDNQDVLVPDYRAVKEYEYDH